MPLLRARIQVVALGTAVVLAAALWAAAGSLSGPRSGGPLPPGDGFHVSITAPAGDVFRWDAGLPFNPTDEDIRLEAVDFVNARDLEVLGVLLSYPVQQPDGVCLGAGNDKGFPPPGTSTDHIAGAVLPRAAARSCTNYPTIAVGLRRASQAAQGSIDGVRVRYRYRDTTYEVVLRSSVDLHRP